ncbi:MAG: dTMP kinase [Saprospiraceae bacterium]|nr:dTMP kinase [Saprospiraceae bacterium]
MGNSRFIVFEGIDGAGKSTLIKALNEKMEALGLTVHMTAEPTKYRIGRIVRSILTGESEGDEKTIAALFLADRVDHLTHPEYGMLQKLEEGTHVLCDRYYLSSYAYHVPHVTMDWVIAANSICADLKRPDLTFFIDISVEESLRRLVNSRASLERFENEERITMVRNNYFEAIDRVGQDENIIVIDGARPFETVFAEIWSITKTCLES